MIKINSWYYRLGNNIIQLNNVLHIALYYKMKISLPDHEFFDAEFIRNINCDNNSDILLEDNKFNFFNRFILNSNIDKKCFDCNNDAVNNILKNTFKIKVDIKIINSNKINNSNKIIDIDKTIRIYDIHDINSNLNTNNTNPKNILIHIRSGDVFRDDTDPETVANYTQPPLSYYLTILQKEQPGTITLIAEDTTNPVASKLLELFPKIKYKQQSLEEDIKEILSANIVVSSLTTFIPALLLMSNNLKKLYRPVNNVTKFLGLTFKNIEIVEINLGNYLRIMHPWKNTDKQKQFMMIYGIDNKLLSKL